MTFNNYLFELLGKQEAKKLKDALKSGKTIIIQGEPQTGKSTFLKVLTNAGYHAVEDFNTYEITLKEPLKNMIPDMLETRDGVIPRLDVTKAAKLMGMNHNTVRKGLQQGVFPWGYAVHTSDNRWSYFINAKRFAEVEGIAL